MAVTFVLLNEYSVKLQVSNVEKFDNLKTDVAIYAANKQLPSMPINNNCYLIGGAPNAFKYVETVGIVNFKVYLGTHEVSFDNALLTETDINNYVNRVELKMGEPIYFIRDGSIYTLDVVEIYQTENNDIKREKIRVDTIELLDYIRYNFIADYTAALPPAPMQVPVQVPMQVPLQVPSQNPEINKLMSEIDALKLESDQAKLSIVDGASVVASAPIIEPENANFNANAWIGLKRPEPIPVSQVEVPQSLQGDFRIDANSYILDDNNDDIELTVDAPLIKRATSPHGIKAWKVNHIHNTRVKLTFDKIIPACKFTRVSHTAEGRIIKLPVNPIRDDEAYDCVYTTVFKNEYIYFLANDVYIDVKIVKVEFTNK
ncbi:hypothetical protein D5b_00366 [Faustovirus]|nr:hypothetical protein D5b_00366 [Faustovirus]AMN84547.1 hypothetical protein D6_00141 [Faustovirus]AMP44310.1 hypothetical protein PRJ_Dakar_00358 [Faustovirus]